MIGVLFRNEWRAIVRDGRGLVIVVLGVLLTLASAWTSASTHARQEHARDAATQAARAAWNEREVDNPHSRAHYGDYVFRPSGALARLDSGLQAVTGRVVYTEAHRQNSAVHRPQQEAASLLRYERLEPSMILQLIAPLVLVLAGFGVVASERETGRLRLLWVQGARPLPLLLAKTLALWTVGVGLCAIVVGAQLVFTRELDLVRTSAFLVVHLAMLWVVAALVVGVSSRSRTSGTAAALLLALWVLGAMVLPRLAAMTATAIDPLPGRDAFQAAMDEDRKKGLDGHNPQDTRRQALERTILETYGVSSRDELPINLGGVLAQADEDYGAQVWDEHFGALEEHQRRQYALAGVFSFVNPLQATDRLSMAIAGTGLASHLEFTRQTETYRRELVRALNEEDAYGVTRGEDGALQRTTTREFYAGFAAFRYQPLSLRTELSRRRADLAALLAWLLAATGFLTLAARRFQRRGSP